MYITHLFLQESQLWKRECYKENHKEENMHSRSSPAVTEKNPSIRGPVLLTPCCSKVICISNLILGTACVVHGMQCGKTYRQSKFTLDGCSPHLFRKHGGDRTGDKSYFKINVH